MGIETQQYYRPTMSKNQFDSGSAIPLDLEKRLRNFNEGETEVFDTPGLIKVIAQYILDLYHKGDMGNALILLENLGEAALSDSIEHREKSLIALSLVAEQILDEENEDLLEAISQLLIRWLKKETEFIAGFEFICLQLGNLVQKMLDLGLWYQSEDLIVALQNIKLGRNKKNRVLTQVISKIQSRIADTHYLKQLTESYVDETNDKSDVAGTLLIHLGDRSAPHLLQTLANCEDKTQRFRLIDLIPAAGAEAIPSLVEFLQNDPPWYLARNIIHMISKIDDPSLYVFIKPFMGHKDIRVQQEVIECLNKMNGSGKTDRLLDALNVCNDSLKPQLIRILGPLRKRKIGSVFIGLLNNYTIFAKHLREDIVKEVCRFMPDYPSEKAIATISALLLQKQTRDSFSQPTLHLIQETLLKLQQVFDSIPQQDLEDFITAIEIPDEELRVPHSTEEQNDELSASKTQPAATLSWLEQALSGNDLSELLKRHVQNRKDFYNQLSHDEFLAFTSLLVHRVLKKDEYLVSIGDVHSTLYFIEDGEISLTFPEDGSTAIFKNLQSGDIIGHDIFMNGSDWTVSLQAQNHVEVFLFDQEQLLHLQPSFPSLCKHVLNYSKSNDVIIRLHETVSSRSAHPVDSEPVPFTGNIGDFLADTEILGFFSFGFCFSCILPQGIDCKLFADRELTVSLESANAEPRKIKALTLGLNFYEKEDRKMCVFAKFEQEFDVSDYKFTTISL